MMRFSSLQYVLVIAVLGLGLSLAGCDLIGSDDDRPDWVGTWELQDERGEMTTNFWAFTEDEIADIVQFTGGPDQMRCRKVTWDVISVDGDTITAEDETIEGEGVVEFEIELSDDRLTATMLDAPVEARIGDELTFESVESLPFDQDECTSPEDMVEGEIGS